MEKPDLTGLTKEQFAYVKYLESCLNGSSELIQQLNYTSQVFAKDLAKICDGDLVEWKANGDEDVPVSTLVLLSGDAKDKTFERVMVLFEKIEKIKALSTYFKTEEKKQQTTQNKQIFKLGDNAFETVVKDIKAKNGSSRI